MNGRVRLAVLFVLVAACTAPAIVPATSTPDAVRTDAVGNVRGPVADEATWARLSAHPVAPPPVAAGTPCPKSSAAQVSPFTGPVAGPGPVFVSGNTLFYTRSDDGTLSAKVAWISRPEYTGPALVRGRRVDVPGDVRFGVGNGAPTTELRFDYDTHVRAAGSEEGWRFLPSSVIVPSAGCYAFQIDGLDWSVTVVMEAVPNP
jgi:hypothetical protein